MYEVKDNGVQYSAVNEPVVTYPVSPWFPRLLLARLRLFEVDPIQQALNKLVDMNSPSSLSMVSGYIF